MDKVQLLSVCSVCHGERFLAVDNAAPSPGRKRVRLRPCEKCFASGMQSAWIPLRDVVEILELVGFEVVEA